MGAKEHDDKIAYLGMIQGVVNRMASVSATLKGISVTLLAGVLAIVFSAQSGSRPFVLAVTFVAVLVVGGFDAWYFSMEKRYRKLYNLVLNGKHPVDFNMGNDRRITVEAREVLTSRGIWLYYGSLLAVTALLFVAGMLGCQ